MSSLRNAFVIAGFLLGCLSASNLVYAQKDTDKNPDNHTSSRPLVFGVAPFMSPVALVKRMSPLRDYLSESLQQTVIIKTSKTAKEYVPEALAGHYDFIMTSPTFALDITDKGSYDLRLTQTRPLAGYLIVLDESPVKTIDDLARKKIGTPPATGFLGQLSHVFIESQGLKDETAAHIEHFHSHNDAISALRLGNIQASFVASFMVKHLNEKGIKTRIIARSRDYPGLTVMTSKKLDEQLAERISQALLELNKNENGKKVLEQISMPGFRPIDIAELETVRPYLMHAKDHIHQDVH